MRKMKVGILTIIDNNNYGNRLQNYATQIILERLGVNCETILNYEYTNFKKNIIFRTLKYYRKHNSYSDNILKKDNFLAFNSNINFSKKRYTAFSKSQYEFVLVGSDQVWNPNFSRLSDVDLLTFVSPKKRISFAASFGITEIPSKYQINLKKAFMNFKSISVREDEAYNIINSLTGRKDISVLIDPTLMIGGNDWLKIAKKPKKVNFTKPYILTYFLGGRTNRINEDLEKYSLNIGAEVYNLLDITQPDLFISGPSEFLYLIANAKLILTDSYHACVFSFMFEKPFLVYAREGKAKDMMSRINTFLNIFDLNRKYTDSNLQNDLLESNYNLGYSRLEKEREKTIKFLKESMGLE